MNQKEEEIDLQNELINSPVAYAVVSNRKFDFGQFSKVNLLFCVLFGYKVDEALRKRYNAILPDIYHQFHEQQL